MSKNNAEDDIAMGFIQAAITLMQSCVKFRWHDLRKNPEDLPEDEVDKVYVCYIEGNRKPTIEYANGVWNPDRKKFTYDDSDDWIYDMDVIAWRYIEPFEEDEK